MFHQIDVALTAHILNFPDWFFWALWLAICVVSSWFFFRMSRWFRHARMIESVPTAKIRSAAQGYVELSGIAKLMDGPLIVSPLSGKTCVWYSYKIEEKVNTTRAYGRSDSYWRVVKQQRSEDLFLLEDDTARCVIDPDNADVIVQDKRTWHKPHMTPPRRYTEQLIHDGEPLYAIGFFRTVATVEYHKTRQQVAALLRQWKQDPNDLLHRFDRDQNQQLDPQEWEQARQSAERQLKRQHGQQEKELPLNVMTHSGLADQAYILSSEPETVLIRQYQWRAVKSLLLFFTTGAIAVWIFNIRFGF